MRANALDAAADHRLCAEPSQRRNADDGASTNVHARRVLPGPPLTTQRRLSELIHSLYAAAEDETAWPRFLEMLAEEVGGGMTVLLSASDSGADVAAAVRADPEALRLYGEQWAPHDVWVNSGHPSVRQPGALVLSEQLVPDREIVKSAFYNDFMRRFDMFRAVVGTLLADDRTSAGLAVHYPRRARPPGKRAIELVTLLMPHLSQALRFHQRWRELELAEQAAVRALEDSATGFVFLDGRGTVLRTNPRAERILSTGDGLTTRDGRLHALLSADDRALQAAIGRTAATAIGSGLLPGTTVSAGRGPGRLPYVVALLPVSADGTIFSRHGAAVVALISDPTWSPTVSSLRLQRTFGWTPAEAAVASALLEGARVREIAERRGVGTETVRTQLKSVFRKAGVSSQSELVRMLMVGAEALASRAR